MVTPGIVFVASYLAWLLLEGWVFSRDRRRAKGRRGDRGSLRTIILAIMGSVTAAFWAEHALRVAEFKDHRAAWFWLGIALMWVGFGLRLWAVATLGRFFRTTVFIQDGHQLITDGPYRVLRHPAYTGSIFTMIGLGLALTNGASLAVMIAGAALAYFWRIRTEETALASTFGEAFSTYRRGTWAVIPFVW